MNSWVLGLILGAIIIAFFLVRGRLKLKLPSNLFSPGTPDIDKITEATEREKEKVESMRMVLEAKKELMRTRRESTKLQKEIASVTADNVDKPEAKKK